jgi:regulator of RNase E activity RraA
MVERDGPVLIAGAPASTGDYVFGDADGVVILPEEIAEEVVRKALDKAKAEDTSRAALREGKLLREVFDEFGVL